MKSFAEVVNGIVVNLIVADDAFIASLPNSANFVEYTESNPAFIDGEYDDGFFYGLKPFESWTKDGKGSWVSPVERPEDALYWDEANQQWVTVEEYQG